MDEQGVALTEASLHQLSPTEGDGWRQRGASWERGLWTFVQGQERPVAALALALGHYGRWAFRALVQQGEGTHRVFFPATRAGRPIVAEIRVRGDTDVAAAHATRIAWTSSAATSPSPTSGDADGPSFTGGVDIPSFTGGVDIPSFSASYSPMDALLASVIPKNWGTLMDLLLLGNENCVCLSVAVVEHGDGGAAPRVYGFASSMRPAQVDPTTARGVLEVLQPGMQARFGLSLLSSLSSLGTSSWFRRFRVAEPERASQNQQLVSSPLVRHFGNLPELFVTRAELERTAARMASFPAGPFSGDQAAARRLLREIAEVHQQAARSARSAATSSAAGATNSMRANLRNMIIHQSTSASAMGNALGKRRR